MAQMPRSAVALRRRGAPSAICGEAARFSVLSANDTSRSRVLGGGLLRVRFRAAVRMGDQPAGLRSEVARAPRHASARACVSVLRAVPEPGPRRPWKADPVNGDGEPVRDPCQTRRLPARAVSSSRGDDRGALGALLRGRRWEPTRFDARTTSKSAAFVASSRQARIT